MARIETTEDPAAIEDEVRINSGDLAQMVRLDELLSRPKAMVVEDGKSMWRANYNMRQNMGADGADAIVDDGRTYSLHDFMDFNTDSPIDALMSRAESNRDGPEWSLLVQTLRPGDWERLSADRQMQLDRRIELIIGDADVDADDGMVCGFIENVQNVLETVDYLRLIWT